MAFHPVHPDHGARRLALTFAFLSLLLTFALAASWFWISQLTLTLPLPPQPEIATQETGPVSPLLVEYKLDLPGRGELFPALAASGARDYWPLAILSIANTADKPVLQLVSAEVPGWSERLEQTVVLGPRETRTLQLSPSLLGRAYQLPEIQRATLELRITDLATGTVHAQSRPVLIHSGSELYWESSLETRRSLRGGSRHTTRRCCSWFPMRGASRRANGWQVTAHPRVMAPM